MDVSAQQHRVITGKYNSSFYAKGKASVLKDDVSGSKMLMVSFSVVGIILYIYILSLLMALCIETSLNEHTSHMALLIETSLKQSYLKPPIISEIESTIDINNILRDILNNCFVILIFHLLKITKNTDPLKQIRTVFFCKD